jgi:hypothetical protein
MREEWCLERGDISISRRLFEVRDFEGLQRLILVEVRNELRLLIRCVLTGGGQPLSVTDNLVLVKARIK